MDSEGQIRFESGFVIHPDPYYAPSYRISPLRTQDLAANFQMAPDRRALEHLNERFAGRKWCFTECGKEGIALALSALRLRRDDCVTILTTSGNRYISSCVTHEIEKVCSWSRDMESNTAALFVNHEFGYPYRDLAQLRGYGLPIIEDACHAYLADTPNQDMGQVGDFIVFSLPKVFPLQIGGILSYDPRYQIRSKVAPGGELEDYLTKVISRHVEDLDRIRAARLANHHMLAARFASLECRPRFALQPGDVPGAFIFTTPAGTDLVAMKQFGWQHGIECSVFYGEDAFFIPVHQRLQETDLDYFYTVFAKFLGRS